MRSFGRLLPMTENGRLVAVQDKTAEVASDGNKMAALGITRPSMTIGNSEEDNIRVYDQKTADTQPFKLEFVADDGLDAPEVSVRLLKGEYFMVNNCPIDRRIGCRKIEIRNHDKITVLENTFLFSKAKKCPTKQSVITEKIENLDPLSAAVIGAVDNRVSSSDDVSQVVKVKGMDVQSDIPKGIEDKNAEEVLNNEDVKSKRGKETVSESCRTRSKAEKKGQPVVRTTRGRSKDPLIEEKETQVKGKTTKEKTEKSNKKSKRAEVKVEPIESVEEPVVARRTRTRVQSQRVEKKEEPVVRTTRSKSKDPLIEEKETQVKGKTTKEKTEKNNKKSKRAEVKVEPIESVEEPVVARRTRNIVQSLRVEKKEEPVPTTRRSSRRKI